MSEHKYRAVEERYWPFLGRDVQEGEVFTVSDPEIVKGLKDQPYVEDITSKQKG